MTADLIHHLLPSIEHLHAGGYWIAFFAAFLETTVAVGLFLPGSTLILFLGALSARGHFDTGDLIWFAVIGAVLGDNLNYALGKRFGARWLEKGFWFFRAEHVEKARRFMDAHGARSVFLGRFIPSVKEVVPFIAGSVKMNRRAFMFWNVLGAAGWGFEWVGAGYLFAQSLNLAQLWLSRAGLLFALIVVLGALFYLLKVLAARKGRQAAAVAASLWRSVINALAENEHVAAWVGRHPRAVSFAKARLDTARFSGLTLSLLIVAFVYVAALFGGIVEDVVTSDPIVAADVRVSSLFSVLRTPAVTRVFTWITLLGKSQVVLVFIGVTAAVLYLWQKREYIFPLFVSVVGSEAFTYLGKLAFHRPRPKLAVYVEHSYSFPSGHATIAMAFYGFVGYLLIRAAGRWRSKVDLFFAAMVVIAAIGFSRLYLGVHYVSDVWSGYLVGAMWLIVAISLSERRRWRPAPKKEPARKARSAALALAAAALVYYCGFSLHYRLPPAPAEAVETAVVAKAADIFTGGQKKFTETLIGERQEPVNFVFLSKSDEALFSAIRQAGWTAADRPGIASFAAAIKALVAKEPHPAAPVSPSFWNARMQDASFAEAPGKSWLSNARHLRIWRTRDRLKNGERIYVGLADADRGFKWGIVPKIAPDLDAERERLYRELEKTGKVKNGRKIRLVDPMTGENFTGDRFFTDGKAYVVKIK